MVWRHWGSGRPLVLLHGGGGSWTHWVRNIDALAATRSVWVPDLPGFGESALPSGETDADALTAIVERSARHAFGSEPCDMVGFSFGGMVAGFIAAEFPERIRRLILVGAPGMGLSSESAVALVSWRKLTDPAERDAAHRRNLRALMLHHDVSVDAFSLSLQMNNTARDRHRGRKLAFTDALAKALKQVRCPVHGIWGQEDVLYRSRHAQLRTVFTSPDFRGLAFIPDAGHWVQYERAGAFNEMLLGLLAED
ncbi:MAG: alpha/beta fold hydrolase [Betaproteobacteria bacterium]|nr:alpha/beta fold hydrolase [Betaproteobacteria bacterium]